MAPKKTGDSTATATIKKPPPGPGWKPKVVVKSLKRYCHWISPVRNIEFTRWAQAMEFERLRKKYGNNEVRAWEKYRQSKVGATFRVVSAHFYDAKPHEPRSTKRKVKEEEDSTTATSTRRKLKMTNQIKAKKVQRKSSSDSATTTKVKQTNKNNNSCTSNIQTNGPHLMDSPFKSCAVETSNDGLNCCDITITRKSNNNKKTSFFHDRFSNKTLRVTSSLSDKNAPEKTIIFVSETYNSCSYRCIAECYIFISLQLFHATKNGMKYTLASAKLTGDNKGGRLFKIKQESIELTYIRGKSVQADLERICAFSLMKPEKNVARLAHLQSECQSILYIKRSDVELIKEEGHEGCGFYPEGFFNGRSKKSNDCDSMQVRIIGPKLGK